MKTTRLTSLLAATLSLVIAATASAVPASKRMGPAPSGSSSAGSKSASSAPIEHKIMKRIGPAGKGYPCPH